MVNKPLGIKKGTKLTDNPKDYMLRVRLTKVELEKLDRLCEHQSISRSEFIRRNICEQYEKTQK